MINMNRSRNVSRTTHPLTAEMRRYLSSARGMVLCVLLSVLMLLSSYGAFHADISGTCETFGAQQTIFDPAADSSSILSSTAAVLRPVAAPLRIAVSRTLLIRGAQKSIRLSVSRFCLPLRKETHLVGAGAKIRFVSMPERAGSDDTLLPVHFGRFPPVLSQAS